jgi:hypothetical protein
MDGMRDPYPPLSPGELTALRRIGGGLGKYAQLYDAYTLIALELVAFDPEGRLVATEAGRQWLRDADAERAVGQEHAVLALDPNRVVADGYVLERGRKCTSREKFKGQRPVPEGH